MIGYQGWQASPDEIVFEMKKKKKGKLLISIIIPVFNGLEYTKTCLQSLSAQVFLPEISPGRYEIIVVDDGSVDGTSDWIRENYPGVHLLQGDGSLWWSGGINAGIKHALDELKTDYVLWWNNDIVPAPGYFTQAVRLAEKNDNNVLIGSKVYILNKPVIWGMGGRFDPLKGSRYMYGGGQPDSETFMKPIEVDWFPGMGTMIHRDVFEKIGLLDEKNFPQYHGDSDFTYRAKQAGFRLVAFPGLIIYNDVSNTGIKHGGSFGKMVRSLTSIKSNSNIKKDIMFYRKHARSPFAWFYLVSKYTRYIGGFYKWKILSFFGIRKEPEHAAG
jgi:GT2 family glycosyltransferase